MMKSYCQARLWYPTPPQFTVHTAAVVPLGAAFHSGSSGRALGKPTKSSRRVAIDDNSAVYLLLSLTFELQEHQHDCTPNDLLAAYAALALRPLATSCFR